jgi:hypothetical protein
MRIPKRKIQIEIDEHQDKEGDAFDGFIVTLVVTDLESHKDIFTKRDHYVRGDSFVLKEEIKTVFEEALASEHFDEGLDED